MNNYKVVFHLEKKKWSEFVFNHPNGNVFQRAVSRLGGQQPPPPSQQQPAQTGPPSQTKPPTQLQSSQTKPTVSRAKKLAGDATKAIDKIKKNNDELAILDNKINAYNKEISLNTFWGLH